MELELFLNKFKIIKEKENSYKLDDFIELYNLILHFRKICILSRPPVKSDHSVEHKLQDLCQELFGLHHKIMKEFLYETYFVQGDLSKQISFEKTESMQKMLTAQYDFFKNVFFHTLKIHEEVVKEILNTKEAKKLNLLSVILE